MATIEPGAGVITLINTFTVEPAHQQELIDLLIEATEQVMSKLPGYISANIHRGLDGRHVANYAQWRSQKDFEAMLRNPEAQVHMERAAKLAGNQPCLYQVDYSDATNE